MLNLPLCHRELWPALCFGVVYTCDIYLLYLNGNSANLAQTFIWTQRLLCWLYRFSAWLNMFVKSPIFQNFEPLCSNICIWSSLDHHKFFDFLYIELHLICYCYQSENLLLIDSSRELHPDFAIPSPFPNFKFRLKTYLFSLAYDLPYPYPPYHPLLSAPCPLCFHISLIIEILFSMYYYRQRLLVYENHSINKMNYYYYC